MGPGTTCSRVPLEVSARRLHDLREARVYGHYASSRWGLSPVNSLDLVLLVASASRRACWKWGVGAAWLSLCGVGRVFGGLLVILLLTWKLYKLGASSVNPGLFSFSFFQNLLPGTKRQTGTKWSIPTSMRMTNAKADTRQGHCGRKWR
jgi:hypothetical protein